MGKATTYSFLIIAAYTINNVVYFLENNYIILISTTFYFSTEIKETTHGI